jgi:hypothetical protein
VEHFDNITAPTLLGLISLLAYTVASEGVDLSRNEYTQQWQRDLYAAFWRRCVIASEYSEEASFYVRSRG